MKRLLFILSLILFLSVRLFGLNVTIIESQSTMAAHDMDVEWQNVCIAMGHTPTIMPQTTLDNNAFFGSTDILIISSGIIALPAPRPATIEAFLLTGKPVYIQGEYLSTYTTNIAFATIVTNLGGTMTWQAATVSGTLAPMVPLGTFATTNNAVAPLGYFWYGCTGTGDCHVNYFLEYNAQPFGFQFCPTTAGVGSLVMTTDQDWVRTTTSPQLCENIMTHMIQQATLCNDNCGPLAIELLSFTGKNKGSYNLLEWQTASETNNDYFTVERSSDGETFEKIGTVAGAGNSNATLSYSYIDNSPPLGGGVGGGAYYRLKQTDYDGWYGYSEIITVQLKNAEANIHPNPTTGEVRITNYDLRGENLEILDIYGRLIKTFVPRTSEFVIDLSSYPAGIYMVRVGEAVRKLILN